VLKRTVTVQNAGWLLALTVAVTGFGLVVVVRGGNVVVGGGTVVVVVVVLVVVDVDVDVVVVLVDVVAGARVVGGGGGRVVVVFAMTPGRFSARDAPKLAKPVTKSTRQRNAKPMSPPETPMARTLRLRARARIPSVTGSTLAPSAGPPPT
jgi:hypothetical protein